jgi:hypothetical protein
MMENESIICQTKNPTICEFYDTHKEFNFEKINLLIIQILSTNESTTSREALTRETSTRETSTRETSTRETVATVATVARVAVVEGRVIPVLFRVELNRIFSGGSVQTIHNSDNYLLQRNNRSPICIAKKTLLENIDEETTAQFLKTCNEQNHNGILISQNSGIVNKYDFEIEIYCGNIYLFIHNMGCDFHKIQMAVSIIDVLHEKIRHLNVQTNVFNISNETLNEINGEFQLFLTQRTDVNNYIREINKTIAQKLNGFKFTSLEKYLSSKITVKKVGQHKCSICEVYTSNTLKGIAAHKKGCVKKHNY